MKRRFSYYDLAAIFVVGSAVRDGRWFAAFIYFLMFLAIWYFFILPREDIHDG